MTRRRRGTEGPGARRARAPPLVPRAPDRLPHHRPSTFDSSWGHDRPYAGNTLVAPPGFSIDPEAGVVSGTPDGPGAVVVTLTADHATGQAIQTYAIQVYQAPQIISTPVVTYLIGVPYRYDADGLPEAAGSAPISWELIEGPELMELDPLTGE